MDYPAERLVCGLSLGTGARDKYARVRVIAAQMAAARGGESVPGVEDGCPHRPPRLSYLVRVQIDADQRCHGETCGKDPLPKDARAQCQVGNCVVDRPPLRAGTGKAGEPRLPALRAPITVQPKHAKRLVTPLGLRPGIWSQPVVER